MDLRITPLTTLQNTLANLARQTAEFARLQEQSATGKRINRPSDQPADLSALLSYQADDQRYDHYLSAVGDARATLNGSVSALQEANNILTQARTIALEGSQSTNDDTARAALAEQIDRLLDRLLTVANTQQAGRYFFAGTATSTRPFIVTATDSQGRPTAVAYQGADQAAVAPIGPRQTIQLFETGPTAFQLRQRSATAYTGSTGAAHGVALDSATGQGTLLVRHTLTSFAGGAGVQPGTSSAAGDSIIGPAGAHQLTIIDTSGTGASGTVSLDGGPAVAFTSADTNLQVSGPNGEIVFLDTTAITPAFNGAVAITADGALSVDGGFSFVPIDFSANQAVTDSVTGAVTNVDSSSIRSAGTEYLDYSGTLDAFQVLMAVRDDLRNTRGLSESDQLTSLSGLVGEIDRVGAGVLAAVGAQSATLQSLDGLESHYQDVQLTTRSFLSQLNDVDLSDLVVKLQAQQNLLQLTLGMTARMFDQNLLDFLR